MNWRTIKISKTKSSLYEVVVQYVSLKAVVYLI